MIQNYKMDGYEIAKIRMVHDTMINYSYLILDIETKECFIVDPAWEMGKIELQISLIGGSLTGILLTHCHYDHTNLVNKLVRKYNPKVYMSLEEIEYYSFEANNLVPIRDMEILNIGKTEVTTILTPGHTTGGTCFLLKDSLFTGDTIFIEGCGICNLDGSSPYEMFESIQKLKALVDKDTRVFTGHSYGKDQGLQWKYLLKENIYVSIENMESFVKFRMRKNQKNLFDFK